MDDDELSKPDAIVEATNVQGAALVAVDKLDLESDPQLVCLDVERGQWWFASVRTRPTVESAHVTSRAYLTGEGEEVDL
jgi:hypothetical protein